MNEENLHELIHNISHDLKSPIRIMNCFTELLLSSIGNDLNEKQKQYVNYIRDSSGKLNNMITSLSEFSKISTGNFSKQEVDITSIVKKIKSMLPEDHVIQIDDIPTIFANPQKIRIWFESLISNSIDFKRDNEHPQIKISYIENEDQFIIIYADNSVGVKQEFHEDIFKIFFKASTDKPNNAGLGLAVVKKIIDLYKGTIEFTSYQDIGVQFKFIFSKELIFSKEIFAK